MSTTVQEGPAAVLGFEPPEGCGAYAAVSLFAETEAVYEQWRDRLIEVGHAPKEHVWYASDSGERLKVLTWTEGLVYCSRAEGLVHCSLHGPREPRA